MSGAEFIVWIIMFVLLYNIIIDGLYEWGVFDNKDDDEDEWGEDDEY